mmetsp:Transcript_19276/g.68107  ORF Transcript_19276/g.68107 Transcript_19276/m.68107 type:complete len:865 (-) Transcript_19276:193-2787(-)
MAGKGPYGGGRVAPVGGSGRIGASGRMGGSRRGVGPPRKLSIREKMAASYRSLSKSSRFMSRTASMVEPTPQQAKVIKFIDQKAVSVTMAVFTVYALFGDDIRLAAFRPSADDWFYGLSCVALLLFAVEMVLNSYAKHDYLWRFYFWLDLLAVLSLIPDIAWIWDPLTGNTGSDGGSGTAIRAGRASRAGTKAGRVVRVVRLVRLVRIVKLYKHVKRQKGEDVDEDPINADQPSQVGKRLSDLTTRRLIILVLAMLVSLPFLDIAWWVWDEQAAPIVGLDALHAQAVNGQADLDAGVVSYANNAGALLFLSLFNVSQDTSSEWLKDLTIPAKEWTAAHMRTKVEINDDFRANEITQANSFGCDFDSRGLLDQTDEACESIAIFDNTSNSGQEALLNVFKTLFVMLTLAVGSLLFTRDAENLVIQPIERMVFLVKQLATNPLATVKHKRHRSGVGYETALLETTLAKIGALLQIGFGEAGSTIIQQNMSSTGALNPLVKGRKIEGIFGFCDIRQFTDATECLQEEVMLFVNEIGDIVHWACHQYRGAANKNIGDAFLIVWMLPEEGADGVRRGASSRGGSSDAYSVDDKTPAGDGDGEYLEDGKEEPAPYDDVLDELVEVTEEVTVEQVSDCSLYSFLKVMVELHKSNVRGSLRRYQDHSAIRNRFPEGYSVRLGFGLHKGWAIEGAIGSRFKIDASYLSPNVNMSARLEAATKQFRTPLLLSESLVESLSPAAKGFLRCIDRVTVKGSIEPIRLYTYDVINYDAALGEPYESHTPIDFLASADFANDAGLRDLHAGLHADFFKTFNRGADAYFAGAWGEAKAGLEEAMALKPEDGPSTTLMEVMGRDGFVAPVDWPGYRALTEK